VNFLIDVNLPPRLARWLSSRGHDGKHLSDLDLLTATDTRIWDRGKSQGEIIVSKDNDFYDRSLIFGAPPQVFHIAVGNCSNARLFELIQSQWNEIEIAFVSGSKLISLTQEKIEVFP
jgi:predicted nuclease of predicted toxin-antitoxin system